MPRQIPATTNVQSSQGKDVYLVQKVIWLLLVTLSV